MSIETNKLMNLADGQVLYNDLRGRIEENVEDVSDLKNEIDSLEGGTTGQILRKKSGTDYDVEWASVAQPTDAQVAEAVDDWLDDHPEATTTVQDRSITFTKLTNSVEKSIDVLYVEDHFDCSGIGVDAETDTELIQEILDYAEENKYGKVVFPKDSHWLIFADPDSYAQWGYYVIQIPTEMTVDLNGAMWEVGENEVSAFNGISFKIGAHDSCICNGTLKGDRNTSSSENANSTILNLSGENNAAKNLQVIETRGDGICFSGSERLREVAENGSSTLSNYTYESGSAVASDYSLSSGLLLLDTYYKFQGNLMVWLGGTSIGSTHLYQYGNRFIYYFYDANENLLYTKKTYLDDYVERREIPENAVYFRFEILSVTELTSFTGRWLIFEVYGADGCVIESCVIDYPMRNGITVSHSHRAKVRNTIIKNVLGKSPQAGIDIEPSRGKAENVEINNVKIYNCGEAALYCSASAYGVYATECYFGSRMSCGIVYLSSFERCIFDDQASFSSIDLIDTTMLPRVFVNECSFGENIQGAADIFNSTFAKKGKLQFGTTALGISLYNCRLKATGFDFYNRRVENSIIEPFDSSTTSLQIDLAGTELIGNTIKKLSFFKIISQTNIDGEKLLVLKNNTIIKDGTGGMIYSVGSGTVDLDYVNISGNKFKSNAAQFFSTLIKPLSVSKSVTIVGNDFENSTTIEIGPTTGKIIATNTNQYVVGQNRNAAVTVDGLQGIPNLLGTWQGGSY